MSIDNVAGPYAFISDFTVDSLIDFSSITSTDYSLSSRGNTVLASTIVGANFNPETS